VVTAWAWLMSSMGSVSEL